MGGCCPPSARSSGLTLWHEPLNGSRLATPSSHSPGVPLLSITEQSETTQEGKVVNSTSRTKKGPALETQKDAALETQRDAALETQRDAPLQQNARQRATREQLPLQSCHPYLTGAARARTLKRKKGVVVPLTGVNPSTADHCWHLCPSLLLYCQGCVLPQ